MKDFIVSKVAGLKLAVTNRSPHLIFTFGKVLFNLTKLFGGCFHNLYSPQISFHLVKKNIFKVSNKNPTKDFNLVHQSDIN